MPHSKKKIISAALLTLALVLSSVTFLKAEEKPLASSALIQALRQEVSGEIAFHYTVLISHFDRIQASKGWHAAADMIKRELEEIGYADAVAMARLAEDAYDALHEVCGSVSPDFLHSAYIQARNILEQAAARESGAVLSTFKFTSDPDIRKEIRDLETEPKTLKLTADEKKLSARIPVRTENFVCPLQTAYISDQLGEQALEQVRISGIAAYEALNCVDGRRSVWEISQVVSAECGPIPAQDVFDFFQLLEKRGLLTWKKE